jgi:hypothetical protein
MLNSYRKGLNKKYPESVTKTAEEKEQDALLNIKGGKAVKGGDSKKAPLSNNQVSQEDIQDLGSFHSSDESVIAEDHQ